MTAFSKTACSRNPMNLIITKAAIDDSEQIVKFLNRIGGETDFLTFGLNEFPFSIEEERTIIKECLEQELCLMLIGKIGEDIVSQLFLKVSSQPRLSHIAHLGISVSKLYWGKSIGTQMVLAAINWAKNKNLTKLQLQVRTDNIGAIELYKKLGFTIEGTITQSSKINNVYFNDYIMGLQICR